MLLTLGATNSKLNEYKKETKWQIKNHFLAPLLEWILQPTKFLYHILFNQMHYMNIAKHSCMHLSSTKEN
jgi:hypothetical protein